jgi:hypothetical protein
MPTVRPPLDPKTSMWHFLAYYLRILREREGLSLTQWGNIIGAARSTVSNQEAGRQRIHEDQAKIIDVRFGTGRLIELLLWFARMAHSPDWFRQFSRYEEEARSIKTYHGQAIPLALQTDEYTWCYVQAGTHKDPQAEQSERLRRKNTILERKDPAFIWALIDEGVLIPLVGGSDGMRAQLVHLRKMADLPHVVVRIVPSTAGAHLGGDGPFQVISLEGRDVAYAGAQAGGRLIEDPSEVRDFSFMFDRIGAKALSEDASRTLIDQYLEKYP